MFQIIFSKNIIGNNTVILTSAFNINLLDFKTNKKLQDFVNFMFNFEMISTENKTTRIIRLTATAIDYIFLNAVINKEVYTGIIKTDISVHFSILSNIRNGLGKETKSNSQTLSG